MEPSFHQPVSPVKSRGANTTAVLSIVISAIAILVAVLASGVSIYLSIDNQNKIARLEEDLSTAASARAQEMEDLKSKSATDLAALKSDFDVLKQQNGTEPDFQISNFNLKFNDDTYYDSYSGDGVISCDQDTPFLVFLEVNLKSGGSSNSTNSYTTYVIVNNRVGKFTTYDWGENGKLEKPQYDLQIVGYLKADQLPGKD